LPQAVIDAFPDGLLLQRNRLKGSTRIQDARVTTRRTRAELGPDRKDPRRGPSWRGGPAPGLEFGYGDRAERRAPRACAPWAEVPRAVDVVVILVPDLAGLDQLAPVSTPHHTRRNERSEHAPANLMHLLVRAAARSRPNRHRSDRIRLDRPNRGEKWDSAVPNRRGVKKRGLRPCLSCR
jgi:hypothetical protein